MGSLEESLHEGEVGAQKIVWNSLQKEQKETKEKILQGEEQSKN